MPKTEITLEEARRIVQEAEQAEQAEQARLEAELSKPYADFKTSAALKNITAKVVELREVYIGKDENRFRRLDTLYRVLEQL